MSSAVGCADGADNGFVAVPGGEALRSVESGGSCVCGESGFEAYRRAVSETFVPLHPEPTAPLGSFRCRLSSWDCGLIQISHVRATPHVVRRKRDDGANFLKLGLQMTGTTLLRQDGRTAVLSPGDFALYDTTRPYELKFRDNYRMVVLMFSRGLLRLPSAQVNAVTARSMSSHEGAGALLWPLVTRLNSEFQGSRPVEGGLLSDAVLSLVAASLSSDSEQDLQPATGLTKLRHSAQAYIDHHLADPHLDVTRVAVAHHVSVRYLQKAFAEQSETVADYIRTQRLERCQIDLADSSGIRTAAAIGARWGFADPGHFSRVFRARYGVPPGEYRALFRGQVVRSA